MPRFVGLWVAASFALILAAGRAPAQTVPPYLNNRAYYGGNYHPPLSPYLNLANGGDPVIQYFLRTLPELDRRATQRVYGAAIGSLENQILQPPAVSPSDVDLFTSLPTTGHPTAFQNTGAYFPVTPLRPSPGHAPGLPR